MVGARNIRIAWWTIALSLGIGLILGLWSFSGPLPAPAGWESYDSLPRRLSRLGHIAGIALPLLNLVYVPWIRQSTAGERTRRLACTLLAFGTLGLPTVLFAAACLPITKYALPLPACAVVIAITILAATLPKEETQ
jgi:hypothetical protein